MAIVEQLPDPVDWRIMQGDSLDFTLALFTTLTDGSEGPPMDLTGYTVRADVRLDYRQSRPTVSFTVTLLPQDQANTKGQVHLFLSPDQTRKLPAGVDAHYDVQASIDNYSKTYVRGSIIVDSEATRG